MTEEYQALLKQGTWVLVHPSSDKRVLGSKWIFKLKRDLEGRVVRHKARLVANGYHQKPGLDFEDTFSPVIKMTTVRLIISLALHFTWPVHQLDVKNAFLHGLISKEIHRAQPQGFVSNQFPRHVCRLNKAICGLRQAPRAWYSRLSQFLQSKEFHMSQCDNSMFIRHSIASVIIILVYVDDILVIGNDCSFVQNLLSELNNAFSMRLLGPLKHFLGIDITYHSSGVSLSQQSYILKLLQRVGLSLTKSSSTPMIVKKFLVGDNPVYSDPHFYRSGRCSAIRYHHSA